ncbi:hypothetical protein cypCar_00044824, partial [Cyprinus carpio]
NDGRFRDKLLMDNQTGSLTIRNIRSEHTGLYELTVISGETSLKSFSVTVYDLTIREQQNMSEYTQIIYCLQKEDQPEWIFRRPEIVANQNTKCQDISRRCELSISLSLPLEVEYQEKNTYSCVINNPIRNQTIHLNITELCHRCADSVQFCGSTEAVIRLVVSALVGVAAVAAVVYDFRSGRAQ